MSLTYKKRGNKKYLYFQAGAGKTFYIMPKDQVDKVNIDNVIKSLNYTLAKVLTTDIIFSELLSYLPDDVKLHYLQHVNRKLEKVLENLQKYQKDKIKSKT
jgi:hypothetical protein